MTIYHVNQIDPSDLLLYLVYVLPNYPQDTKWSLKTR